MIEWQQFSAYPHAALKKHMKSGDAVGNTSLTHFKFSLVSGPLVQSRSYIQSEL